MDRYRDRAAAGRVLADAVLARGPYARPVVLALPRGGVPVGTELAAALNAPLAVVPVRKISAPGHPELAIGALARVGAEVSTYRNEDTIASVGIGPAAFARAEAQARDDLAHRSAALSAPDPAELAGADVVLVDDGLATGSTMQAAVTAVRRLGPAQLVVAVPVASASAVRALQEVSDALVCPLVPTRFVAVGLAYVDFTQLSDADVRVLLARRSGREVS